MLRSRERRSPPTEHAALWSRSLAWSGLRRRLWEVTAGIFAACAVFAVVLRILLPDYQLAYPQVMEVETAVAFILLYFFVPEMAPRGDRPLPAIPLLARIRRSSALAAGVFRRAVFTSLLGAGSVLPLILVRPLRSATVVPQSGEQLPVNWAAHFLSGEAAFFCYLLVAVVAASALASVVGGSFWYRLALLCFTAATLPQAAVLWEPVVHYLPAKDTVGTHAPLEAYAVESAIRRFHGSVANPPPYPDVSHLNDAIVALAVLIRRLVPTLILAYLGSFVVSLVEALRPAAGVGAATLALIRKLRLHRPRLLPHLLGSLAIIGLAAMAVAFLGGYVELAPGQGTARPIAVFTLAVAAVIVYVVARAAADYVGDARGVYAGLPAAALMRAQLGLTASYALVLVSWGGVGLGVLIYLLGLTWASFIAVVALLLLLVAASLLVALIVVALSHLQAARRSSSVVAGFIGGLGLTFAAFLFYPPASSAALLHSRAAEGPALAAMVNQMLLLETVNYPAAFDRWLNLAEFAGSTTATLVWLGACVLSGLLILVALIWLAMRLARRLA